MRRALALIAMLTALRSARADAANVVLQAIETTSDAEQAIVLRLSAPVTPHALAIPATASLPARLAIDLPDTEIAPAVRSGVPGRPPVRRVRTGQLTPSVARVVLDLEHAIPYRLETSGAVVRVVLVAPHGPHAAAPATASRPTPVTPLPPVPRTVPHGHPLFLDYGRELAGEEPLPEPPSVLTPQRPAHRMLHLDQDTKLPALE